MVKNEFATFEGLKRERLEEILFHIKNIKIALIGDICLDMYWKADMNRSEISRETPHFPLPVVEEWASPGGGGNAAVNIAALKPQEIFLLGVIGEDWRGALLREKLADAGIDHERIIRSRSRITTTFCKPIRKGISQVEYEDPRIDFDNYEELSPEDESVLLELLDITAKEVDVLCVSDQVKYGCITKKVREKIISLGKEGLTVVVDSRDRIGLYTDVILKPNEVEGCRATAGENFLKSSNFEEQVAAAKMLAERNRAKVCMTLGSKGCVVSRGAKEVAFYVPSHDVSGPVDTCGAGDCFLSAFSCAVAAGASEQEAGAFANLAAEVIIRKVGTTGTATPEEISDRHNEIFCG